MVTSFVKADAELRSPYRAKKIGGRNGKVIRLHRLVYAEKTGVTPTSNQIVHHKNGNKLDNDPDNLELVDSRSRHAKLHAALSPHRIQPRPCAVCGKMFKPVTDGRTKFPTCSVACGADYKAKISVQDVVDIEKRRTSEPLGSILQEYGFLRKSYEQRRRILRRRGRVQC